VEGKTTAEIDLSYQQHINAVSKLKQNLGYERCRRDNKGAPNLMAEALN
jgi:hypothetical protein